MRQSLYILLLCGVLTSSIASAFVGDYDPNPSLSSCVSLQGNLWYRARDFTTNGEVSLLQDYLNSAGYLEYQPTGFFGKATLQAVKDFQRNNYLDATGYVGPLTREKIKRETCPEVIIAVPTVKPLIGIVMPVKETVVHVGQEYSVGWTQYPEPVDQYSIYIGNRVSGQRYNAGGGMFPNETGSFPMTAEFYSILQGNKTVDQVAHSFYVEVAAIKNSPVPGNETTLYTATSETFTILP